MLRFDRSRLPVPRGLLFLFLPVALCSCLGLKTARGPGPGIVLKLDHIEASSPDDISIFFICRISNPRLAGASFSLKRGRISINNSELTGGNSAELEGGRVEGEAEASFNGVYRVDLKKAPLTPQEETISARITLDLDFVFDDGRRLSVPALGELRFPRIQEPVFTIESIRILQAELINTRLKVKIKIDNPNPFPVSLSSFKYELYGAGRYWAEGKQKNVYTIPGRDSAGADLYLVMNFTNMRREVLDRVIEMRLVRYRFAGETEISSEVEYLPVFTGRFDLEGESEVSQ
jgi:LEA14-like dessication related protein